MIETIFELWLRSGIFQNLTDLKGVEARLSCGETRRRTSYPRSTDEYEIPTVVYMRKLADSILEASRGFGFIRFPSLEDSKAFVERNYPMIYLYGNGSTDNDNQAAKVRIAYSRERDDRSRGEKADGEWTCKIVRSCLSQTY